jgi:hypothetical protein
MDEILHTKLGPGLDFDPLKDKEETKTETPLNKSNVEGLVKCPYCGGDTGYQYKLHIYGIQYYDWDNDPENACFSDTGGKQFKKVCSDCGKGI